MGSYLSNIASRSNSISNLTQNNLMKPAGSFAGKKERDDMVTEDDKNDLSQDSFLYAPRIHERDVQSDKNKKAGILPPSPKSIVPDNDRQLHVEKNIAESSQKRV